MAHDEMTDDEMSLFWLIVTHLGAVIALCWWAVAQGAAFLVRHGVLVTGPSVLVSLPHAGGAGLDATRLGVALTVVAALLIISISSIRHRATARGVE